MGMGAEFTLINGYVTVQHDPAGRDTHGLSGLAHGRVLAIGPGDIANRFFVGEHVAFPVRLADLIQTESGLTWVVKTEDVAMIIGTRGKVEITRGPAEPPISP
jgi:hypothetical protein